ncbi:hypothetical protein D3C86_1345450 [compost metagenome]
MFSRSTPVFRVMSNFSFRLPFFVVTRITPLAALDPYIAAAEGPLSTEMFSISSGFRSWIRLPTSLPALPLTVEVVLMSELSIGVPSITYKGWLFPVMELMPRSSTRVEPPMLPPDEMTCKPATLPEMALRALVGRVVSSSDFTS